MPALWLHPLDAPLTLLLAPLVGGVVLLTVGLGLNALEARWGGEMRRWLLTDAALIVVYLGLLAALFSARSACSRRPPASSGSASVMRCSSGASRPPSAPSARRSRRRCRSSINTLSFARVGAFALAHAGLSSAVVTLADAADNVVAKALVLVLGNALVIVLEAMVVSIQTTRLVLFEFFARFMQGQGRAFRPLPAPPFVYQENSR